MQKKIVGILGGMGPLATVDLMEKIIRQTPAAEDSDHLRLLVDSNAQIPSRVKAILEKGESPVPLMRASLLQLEHWGAQLIAMPCNTAHYFFPQLVDAVEVPLIHMIQETVKVIAADDIKEVLLLGTQALLELKLYEEPLQREGIGVLVPSAHEREAIMKAIEGVKGGDYSSAQEILTHFLAGQGKGGGRPPLILGCTELPIILNPPFLKAAGFQAYDPTTILAQAILAQALG